jgi:hypothetical protein
MIEPGERRWSAIGLLRTCAIFNVEHEIYNEDAVRNYLQSASVSRMSEATSGRHAMHLRKAHLHALGNELPHIAVAHAGYACFGRAPPDLALCRLYSARRADAFRDGRSLAARSISSCSMRVE